MVQHIGKMTRSRPSLSALSIVAKFCALKKQQLWVEHEHEWCWAYAFHLRSRFTALDICVDDIVGHDEIFYIPTSIFLIGKLYLFEMKLISKLAGIVWMNKEPVSVPHWSPPEVDEERL